MFKFLKNIKPPAVEDFEYPEGYTVIQNGYGLYQAWKGGMVIRPDNCELLNDYQQNHDWMFVSTLRQAQKVIVRHVHTQKCREPVKVFGAKGCETI